MPRRAFYLAACDTVNTFPEGYVCEDEMEELRDQVVTGQEELFGDLKHQVTLQIRKQQELLRRTRDMSPHRTDMVREQDVAIHALKNVLKRFDVVAGDEVDPSDEDDCH